jgi:SulP family sulfate permease
MIVPQFVSFQGFTRARVRADFLAALVVTAIAIPESLGFAAIVGLPVQTGLYCALLAPIIFAIFTSSKHLVVGADSATAALVASGAATVATAGTSGYDNAVAVLGIMTGAVLVVMALLRMGFLADLISKPVFVGFLAGIGLQLMITKAPEMLGLNVHGSTLHALSNLMTHLSSTHLYTLAFSACLLALLLLANRRSWPGSLLVLFIAILASIGFQLEQHGVRMIGEIDGGLPAIVLPSVSMSLLEQLFPFSLAIAAVILAQSTSVIRSTATRFDEKVDDNRDLTALGAANVASAITGGFAINGSPPRTAAAEMSGGRTQLVNIFMAIFVGLVLLIFSSVLSRLPVAVLAVIVFAIGLHLFDIGKLRHIYITRRTEFFIALVALLGVAFFGVLYGVAIAVTVSVLERLRRQYHPTDDIMIRDRKLAPWAKERLDKHHKYRSSPPGLIVYRFAGSIFFENSDYFKQRVLRAIKGAKQPVTCLIIDAGSINDIDYTASETIRHLVQKLAADDIRFVLAHVPPELKTLLKKYGLVDIIGKNNIYASLEEAVFDLPNSRRSTIDMIKRLDPPSGSYVVIGGGVLEALGLRETNDVDLVVSERLYRHYRKKGWREYVQDDGKRVLSHHGYQLMLTYVGKSLKDLAAHAFLLHGVSFMSVSDLIACKKAVGREKDLEDVRLLQEFERRGKIIEPTAHKKPSA